MYAKVSTLQLIAVLFLLTNCSQHKKKAIHFSPIGQNEFTVPFDTTFIPVNTSATDQSWEAIQKMHDSCMGMSFPANAYFMRTKDTFSLGCIVDKKTMVIVKNMAALSASSPTLFGLINVMVSKPCYTKIPNNIPVDALFRKKAILKLSPPTQTLLGNELNGLIQTAAYTQVETGSWSYIELTNGLGKILDTTTDASLLQYKEALLQKDNMVLIRSGGITDITFHITTPKPLSKQLTAFLAQKPFATVDGWNMKPQVFYIDDTHIELYFSGYFQVMGQFMKAELR